MRRNEPVVNEEVEVEEGSVLVSKTDLEGRITFVNAAFIAISGFTEEQLIGSPHNLVRHPDMPQSAFADLWATVKAGRPWEAYVKNRRMDGRYYWVRANVTPLVENGEVVGYISIRVKAGKDKQAEAEQVYAAMRNGQANHLCLREGRVERVGAAQRFADLFGSIRGRLWAQVLAFAVFALLVAIAGLAGSPTWTGVVAIAGLAVSVVLAMGVSRAALRPLARMEEQFTAIAKEDLTEELTPEDIAEFRRPNAMLRAMRAKLGYGTLEKAELSRRAETMLKGEMLALTEVLEHEVEETVGDISAGAERLSSGAARLLAVADEVRAMANEVSHSIDTTAANVQTVAGATEELEASSREISSQVRNSSQMAETARGKVELANERMTGLTEATAKIGSVVGMIQAIAGQTRMLALNATIEAARAGEAGKGFAVVAEEVKGLARQTEDGIDTVSAQANAIGQTTSDAVAVVDGVVAAIRDIDAISAEVAHSADEQRAATAEIMSSAVQAAQHTRAVADNVGKMMESVEATGKTAVHVTELSSILKNEVSALQKRLSVILRSSYGGDRRREERAAVAVRFTARFGQHQFSGYTGDLSVDGGAWLVAESPTRSNDIHGQIEVDGVGALRAEITNQTSHGIHVRFRDLTQANKQALRDRIDTAIVAARPRLELCQDLARKVGEAFTTALRQNQITEQALFDAHYTAIAGTDPIQMLAPHSDLAEKLLPALIEPPLAAHADLVFCIASDRHGYIAVHNRAVSQPQRPDDPQWNLANCRNRRVYDDRAAILAARCTQPTAQTYARDNGAILIEYDAPILVDGKAWGALRTAYRLH